MKKTLSVLLILAAIFGFYGGAVNLTDVLACKGYWEEEGKKTTADLNKLEDGIKELRKNEKTYLDGVDQLKDGEIKLADGRAELAKGEADYKAAPAKLEAGKQKLADGEAAYEAGQGDLSDGKESLKSLVTLINGLKGINTGFEKEWHPGFAKTATKPDYSDAGLKQARGVINSQLAGQAEQIALVEQLSGKSDLIDNAKNASTYQNFDKAVLDIIEGFDTASTKLKDFANLAGNNTGGLDQAASGLEQILAGKAQILAGTGRTEEQLLAIPDGHTVAGLRDEYKALTAQAKGVRLQTKTSVDTVFGAMAGQLALVQALDATLYNNIVDSATTIRENAPETTDAQFIGAVKTLSASLKELSTALNGKVDTINASKAPLLAWDAGYKKLLAGQAKIAAGVQQAYGGMLSNPVIKKQLEAKGALAAVQMLASPALSVMDFDNFDVNMQKVVAINNQLIPALQATYNQGLKTVQQGQSKLNAAAGQLAAGREELRKSLATFAAAPGKLAEGRAELAAGEKQLADGKAKLAEYEDGEKQVRDGLAKLMATEPNGGLTSILERFKNDDNFNDPNGHLLFDKSLDAVGVGREYQGDSGAVITKELVNRGIGSGAGLAAGVLAVIAALLSFGKKNKAAGVAAILAGVAGVAGIVVGKGAGMEMSTIAGSLVGATPYIAFGILAAVAVIHAITHFASKDVA